MPLKAMGLASSADVDSLAVLCEAIVLHQKASRLIAETSILVKGSRSLIVNKAILVQREAAATVRQLAQEFGLTPAARMSVEVNPDSFGPTGNNPFAG